MPIKHLKYVMLTEMCSKYKYTPDFEENEKENLQYPNDLHIDSMLKKYHLGYSGLIKICC